MSKLYLCLNSFAAEISRQLPTRMKFGFKTPGWLSDKNIFSLSVEQNQQLESAYIIHGRS